MERVILHSDLNNFYASVECLYRPELREVPMAVCGSPESRHGIILAKNTLAKRAGVVTAETIRSARDKCPQLTLVSPTPHLYGEYSQRVREIYRDYTDQVEPFGIDEAWLDVTGSGKLLGDGPSIAEALRRRVKRDTGLTVSVGVSFNKVFAKLGSDLQKPDAVTVVARADVRRKLHPLPVQELLYVGPATRRKLNLINIFTIGDLAKTPLGVLLRVLGRGGDMLWRYANGLDDAPVGVGERGEVKSIGNSTTTPRDMSSVDEAKATLFALCESVAQRMREANLKGRTVQVSVCESDMESRLMQTTLRRPTWLCSEIADSAMELLRQYAFPKPIRHLGVRCTQMSEGDKNIQLSFLPEEIARDKREMLERTLDHLRDSHGTGIILRGTMMREREMLPDMDNRIEEVFARW